MPHDEQPFVILGLLWGWQRGRLQGCGNETVGIAPEGLKGCLIVGERSQGCRYEGDRGGQSEEVARGGRRGVGAARLAPEVRYSCLNLHQGGESEARGAAVGSGGEHILTKGCSQ